MYKFIKKPVAIEAFQMTKERRWDNKDWPRWLHQAWNYEVGATGSMWCIDGGDQLYCGTLEGEREIRFGDYIIQGVHGDIYTCRPDIFEKTYHTEQEYVNESPNRHEAVNRRRVTFSGGISYDRAESIFRFLVDQGFSVTVEDQRLTKDGWRIEAVANAVKSKNA